MANIGGSVDGGRELAELSIKQPLLGRVLQRLLDGVNTLATNTATSATGETAAPRPPDSVQVSPGGDMMHIAITHNGPLNRNIRYFSEISTDKNFSQPIVIDHGASRTSHPVPLPTKNGDGSANHTYYVRSYAQYPSSQPSPYTVVGGASNPTPFTLTGASQMDLLPSQGSGTASSNGQQGGSGLGKVQRR